MHLTIMEVWKVILFSLCYINTYCYFQVQNTKDKCFCQLQGHIDDCSCNIDTVDHFNNVQIYPRLQSLLSKEYFRFYKVNLKRKCPFWTDDSRCAIRYCHVEACLDENIPVGLKGEQKQSILFKDAGSSKYKEPESDCDHNEELSYLNTTISASTYEEFALWKAYDDAQDNFCIMTEHDNEAEYVDLSLNPERYTGYKGKSAHRIWRSIYMENCFRPDKSRTSYYIHSDNLSNMCLEKRAFYRAISGIHASINIHLSAKYLLSERSSIGLANPHGFWGQNLQEFQRRFSPETTNGEGPNWLKNLYFVYLLELRALAKASPYLQYEEFYTGDERQDFDTQMAIKDLLNVVNNFKDHFNEQLMFSGNDQIKLKEEFKQHFRNISKIMDCVGCDKCKLWGKLQIQGLGTALKILFSGKFDQNVFKNPSKFQLQRSEIVSLVNGLGRLSTSIYELEEFRKIIR